MFFIIGSLPFYILISLAFILLIITIEYENVGLATISLAVTAALLGYFGNFNVFQVMKANPISSVILLALYFIAGVLWSLCKWWFYLRNIKLQYTEAKNNFLTYKDVRDTLGTIPAELKAEFAERIRSSRINRPLAKDNKSRIITWMMYWPWSAIWTLINDPVKRMFKAIYNHIQHIFEKISLTVWKDFEEDKPTEQESREFIKKRGY